MSYIFARTDGTEGIFFADSLLSPINGAANPKDLNDHGLKIHVLDGKHCIAFAGIYGPCINAISKFSELPVCEKESSTSHLNLNELIKAECSALNIPFSNCDLIYLRKLEDKAELFLLKDGLLKLINEGYIGDSNFHEEFLKSFANSPYTSVPGDEVLSDFSKYNSRIMNALHRLGAKSFPTVSPIDNLHWVRVATDKKYGFVYLASASSGRAGGSGGMVSMFHISKPVFGFAVFIQDEKAGYVFYSGSGSPHKINGLDFHEFSENVKHYNEEQMKFWFSLNDRGSQGIC